MNHPEGSIGALRQQRQAAEDWIGYASWAAMGSSVLGAVAVALFLVAGETEHRAWALSLIPGLAGQALIGHHLGRTRSRWSAWALLASYGYNFGVSLVINGFSGIVAKCLLWLVYVRGFVGAMEHRDLETALETALAARDQAAT